MRGLVSRLATGLFALSAFALGGCSAGGGSSVRPQTTATSGAVASARGVAVTISIAVPSQTTEAKMRRPQFVGAATNGIAVVVKDHNSQATLATLTANLSPGSQSCGTTDEQGDRSCTIALALVPTAAGDSDDFDITTYDQAPSGGTIPAGANQLASGVVLAQQIVAAAANTVAVTLDGIPASVVPSSPRIVFPGDAGKRTRTFVFSALDADGETIVGSFSAPITLTVSDTGAHTTLGVGSASGSSATLSSSSNGDDVVISYDGSGGSSYQATIAATGVPSPSSVPVVLFTVTGPAAYSESAQTVTFTAASQPVALTLSEPTFTGSFTESDTCGGIATIAIGPASNGSATATVTSGAGGSCAVSFGDGNFSYPAISLDDVGASADATLTTIVNDAAKTANQYNTPGGAIDVYYHGKTYVYYFGVESRATGVKVSSATGFELGSVTKTVTALGLALAVDDPALIASVNPSTTVTSVALTDPAAKYIPLYPAAPPESTTATGSACPPVTVPTPVPAGSYSATYLGITLQDLGDHTSTLPDQPPNIFGAGTLPVVDRPCYPSQTLENYAATYNAPSGATLGSTYDYSDIGFGLLGDALQGIYDAPYFTLTKSLILTPLSMPNTYDVGTAAAGYGSNYATPYLSDGATPTYDWPYNAWPGGGTLRSTGPDMMNYLTAALQLSPNSQINAAMATAQTPVQGVFAGTNEPQGLAWAQETLDATGTGKPFTVTWKDGATGGMTAWIGVVNPGSTSGVGIVVMTNEAGGGDIPGASGPAPSMAQTILKDLGP